MLVLRSATEARLREEKREMMNRVRSVLANFKSDKAKREKEVAALKEQASTAQKREQRHVDALKTMKKRVRDTGYAWYRGGVVAAFCNTACHGVLIVLCVCAVGELREDVGRRRGTSCCSRTNTRVRLLTYCDAGCVQRQMKAQAKEDGIMASAFYSLGLVGLSDDALDAPRAWLGNTRHLRRAARSPM